MTGTTSATPVNTDDSPTCHVCTACPAAVHNLFILCPIGTDMQKEEERLAGFAQALWKG